MVFPLRLQLWVVETSVCPWFLFVQKCSPVSLLAYCGKSLGKESPTLYSLSVLCIMFSGFLYHYLQQPSHLKDTHNLKVCFHSDSKKVHLCIPSCQKWLTLEPKIVAYICTLLPKILSKFCWSMYGWKRSLQIIITNCEWQPYACKKSFIELSCCIRNVCCTQINALCD